MTPITYGYRPKIIVTYPRYNDPKPPMTSEAIDLIWTERERQLAKGYDAAHDDARPAGALVDAALCHAITRNGENLRKRPRNSGRLRKNSNPPRPPRSPCCWRRRCSWPSWSGCSGPNDLPLRAKRRAGASQRL